MEMSSGDVARPSFEACMVAFPEKFGCKRSEVGHHHHIRSSADHVLPELPVITGSELFCPVFPFTLYFLSRFVFKLHHVLAFKKRQQKEAKSFLIFNEPGEAGCVSFILFQHKLSVPRTVGEAVRPSFHTILGMVWHMGGQESEWQNDTSGNNCRHIWQNPQHKKKMLFLVRIRAMLLTVKWLLVIGRVIFDI